MELNAALEGLPKSAPSAEDILRLRIQERQRKQREADEMRAEADRIKEEQERQSCERLQEEIARECSRAITRLAAANYPSGGLRQIVTRYEPDRRWFGRRYHRQFTVVRACWFISVRDGAAGEMYLSSEGALYRTGANPHGYRDRSGRTWGGLHPADISGEESWRLRALLDSLKGLPEAS